MVDLIEKQKLSSPLLETYMSQFALVPLHHVGVGGGNGTVDGLSLITAWGGGLNTQSELTMVMLKQID